jgi:hypothetical protein
MLPRLELEALAAKLGDKFDDDTESLDGEEGEAEGPFADSDELSTL